MMYKQNTGSKIGALGGLGFVVLFMLGAIVSNVATTATYPRPDASAATVHAYFAQNAGVVGFLSITQAAAAVLLMFFTGVAVTASREPGESRSVESSWAALGGALAAAFLLLSALLAWALSRQQVLNSPQGLAALHQLAFAAGGVGHVVPLGVLVGASSLAALHNGIHARWLATVGMISGALSLSSLVTVLVLGPVIALIPLGRFTAFFYIIAVSVLVLRGRLRWQAVRA